MSTIQEIPTQQTVKEAREALRNLARLGGSPAQGPLLSVTVENAERAQQSVSVPRQAFELFLEVLGQLANGNAVTIVPVQAELTTQQAAELLNVSRPFLVGLLERGVLPHRKVGSHRRISASDVFAYKRRDAQESEARMAELAAEAQRLGLGY